MTQDPRSVPAFTFQDAEGYERLMGRWSRRLAPLLIEFGGLAPGERVLDVGCGTGSLTVALQEAADLAAITAIDVVEPYVSFARARSRDPRVTFERADARALPFADASFDRAFSMLVLLFIPDAERAVAEMRRVVRPGGRVTAAVWDTFGGAPQARLIWDVAGVLDPAFERPLFRPMTAPGEMAQVWHAQGLVEVEQTSLLIRMEFASFDDYWSPYLSGEGPIGKFVVELAPAARARLQDHVRRAYLANRPDGPRSFPNVAWACRGTVPDGSRS
ncbi:MAG: class I SAM-dependent methyltransferase [Proteobacteria bacterium]|nr:class I SAM-dependent methyltransferase [Pseudomonadota bacterium]